MPRRTAPARSGNHLPLRKDVRKELAKLEYEEGVHYDRIISVVDWLLTQDINMWTDHKNTWWCDDEDWWSAKAKICEEEDIAVVVDDCDEFKPYFDLTKTTFILVGHEEIATHKTIRQWAQRKLDAATEADSPEKNILKSLLDFINE